MPFKSRRAELVLDEKTRKRLQALGASYTAPAAHVERGAFTPKHGPWLNLIEAFFSKLARTLLRGIRVGSKAEVKERIERHLAELNQTRVIFRWKYGPQPTV